MSGEPQLVSSHLKKLQAFDMHYLGLPYKEIAKKLEVPVATITTYFSREWRDEYDIYATEQSRKRKQIALTELRVFMRRATEVLARALEHDDARVRIAASKEILDRTLGRAPIMDLKAIELSVDPVATLLREFGLFDADNNLIPEEQ